MAIHATQAELTRAGVWYQAAFAGGQAQALPFSFVYGDQTSAALLGTWRETQEPRQLDEQRYQQTLTYTDPQTGLQVRCTAVRYSDYPVVEWVLYLKNAGTADTPLLSHIQALNVRFAHPAQTPGKREFLLHHLKGDSNTPDSYQPLQTALKPNTTQHFAPVGGRPTNGMFPYFNLEWLGQGAIVALGWPGQWAADFARDSGGGVQITGGQELTHFILHPGEEIRTPLVVLMFWDGDRERSQNLWRRWMMAHNLPRPGGQPPAALAIECCEGFYNFKNGEAEMRQAFEGYVANGIRVDLFWRDAGWYPCENWWETGTWEIDRKRFPHGFKPLTDWVHARGKQFIVWWEPERVRPGTWLFENHPEWLLPPPGQPQDAAGNYLLNLGDAAARQWVIERVDRTLVEEGIDLYRQDFNMDPLAYWRANDARLSPIEQDRQGITEIYHVMGYLAYWDELQRRHPGMLIDSCASGGRRNDLETLRRGLPLGRSDYQSFTGDPQYAIGNQGHTYGLSSWLPYYGQGVYWGERWQYVARSHLCPAFGTGCDVRRTDIAWPAVRRLMADWERIASLMMGDFYPLTSYSLDERDWMAWQFDCPETGEGAVQVFRRERSPFLTAQFPLRGLEPQAVYQVTDLDAAGQPLRMAGSVLLQKGLSVTLADCPQAGILVYKKIE